MSHEYAPNASSDVSAAEQAEGIKEAQLLAGNRLAEGVNGLEQWAIAAPLTPVVLRLLADKLENPDCDVRHPDATVVTVVAQAALAVDTRRQYTQRLREEGKI